MDPVRQLNSAGYPSAYILWSALDSYFRIPSCACPIAATEAGLAELAKLSGELSFPGLDWADVLWTDNDRVPILLRCSDRLSAEPASAILQGRLLADADEQCYHDPFSVYPSLRSELLECDTATPYSWLMCAEAAIFLSRYGYQIPAPSWQSHRELLSPFEQRNLLTLILSGAHARTGLEYLRLSGFIAAHWPLLATLEACDQDKDYHPEGDVWQHSIHAIACRKKLDPEIGLALLLHDCGKPSAVPQDGNRFHRHAQIGARLARDFLVSLDYPDKIIQRIEYLILHHMFPSFFASLPPSSIQQVLDNPLFPRLLELYRCDIASSYRSLEPYYKACTLYRAYTKKQRIRRA